MGSGKGCCTNVVTLYQPALPPISMDSTTVLHSLVFLTRVFAVGAFVIISFVLASLLEGEVARAWAGEIRRIVKRDTAERK